MSLMNGTFDGSVLGTSQWTLKKEKVLSSGEDLSPSMDEGEGWDALASGRMGG